MKKSLIAILLFSFGIPIASAEQFRRIGQGIRNLAMGNVGIALSHDESALYYNPAGLGGIDDVQLSLSLFGGGTGVDASDLPEAGDLAENIEFLLNRRFYIRFFGNITVITPIEDYITFGATAFAELEGLFFFQNPVLPQFTLDFRADTGHGYGVGIPIGKGGLVIGIGFRSVKRLLSLPETTFSLDNLLRSDNEADNLLPNGYNQQALANAFDFGIHWRIEGDLAMTIGAVIQNAGGLNFSRGGRSLPEDVPEEIAVGISIQPDFGFFRILAELDFRDITNAGTSDNDATKRIHAGMELGLLPLDTGTNVIAIRGGYNQGYAAYGGEITIPLSYTFILPDISVEFVSYAEETGETAGSGRSFRRALQLSFTY